MPDDDESSDQHETLLDPDVLEMIAENLDDRATTLQAEAERFADESEQLREMTEKLRD